MEAGETGTPHLQGYVVFKRDRRLTAIKNDFGCNPHLDIRNGSHSQAKHYVSKPHDDCICKHCVVNPIRLAGPWTYGSDDNIPESQGARSDLAGVKRKLDEGASMVEISNVYFADYCRYNKSFSSYKRLHAPKRNWVMEVITLFGKTGTGKTQWVHDMYGEDLYSVPYAKSSGTYWDDYDGQETVLIDEMYGKRFSHGFLLMLLDKYAFTVPVHGSSVNFSSRRIIMTSNTHPSEWYASMYEKTQTVFYQGPLHRRLVRQDSCIIHCSKDSEGYYKEFRLDDDYKLEKPSLL